MKTSDYVAGFLNPNTQRAYAQKKAGAADDGGATPEAPKAPKPGVLTKDLLLRLKRIVLAPSVTTIEQVNDRFEALLDALDDEDAPQKKSGDGPSSNARTKR